jgi:hypothetical protein
MDSFQRALFVFVLIFGTVSILPFLASTIYKTLKTGVIERKPPRHPFTRTGTPKAFWATMGIMAIGPVIMVWGGVVMLYRLLHT